MHQPAADLAHQRQPGACRCRHQATHQGLGDGGGGIRFFPAIDAAAGHGVALAVALELGEIALHKLLIEFQAVEPGADLVVLELVMEPF